MTIRIDKENNIVRILLRDVAIEESDESSHGVIYDYDSQGLVVGLEFLNASDILGDLDELYREHTEPKKRTQAGYEQYIPVESASA